MTSCIHDHPENGGNDPTMVELGIELTLELKWNQRATNLDLNTRARGDYRHRVVIEISRGGKEICRETVLLTPDEFALGELKHKLSVKLHALEYEMAIWSDFVDTDGKETAYNANHLKDISQIDPGILWDSDLGCGYCSSTLDLRAYRDQWNTKVVKEMELGHAGARFQLVSTDIKEFVDAQQHALLNGETYTLTITYSTGTGESFNAYTGIPERADQKREITGILDIPFRVYDELELADCYLFTNDEENVTMNLTVHNSARMIIVKTQDFRFTVRRGTITRVKGDFLSDYFTNFITVDNIWAGEILIEI